MSRSRRGPVAGGSPLPALPWRVVLDTNVVVSGLLFAHGPAARVRLAWQSRLLEPFASRDTVAETVRVLAYPKFRLSADDQQELLADYLPAATTVPIPSPPPAVPDCRDVHDLPFLHLAVAGRADALVTGDTDLLALAPAAGIGRCRILTLAELLAHLPASPGPIDPAAR
ncbi:MAG: putative toxin-antitoxin system toxin component, PIN family [Rubrivivax sp.]